MDPTAAISGAGNEHNSVVTLQILSHFNTLQHHKLDL